MAILTHAPAGDIYGTVRDSPIYKRQKRTFLLIYFQTNLFMNISSEMFALFCRIGMAIFPFASLSFFFISSGNKKMVPSYLV